MSNGTSKCIPSIPGDIVVNLVDHIDAMVAFWDKDQRCVFANNAYREWFGKTREEMLGTRLQDLLGPLYKKNLPYITAAYAGRKQVFEREIPTPDGRSIRYSLATYTPYIVDGEVQGIFVHVADVTPLKKLEAELRASKARSDYLATHDELTGLPNRAALWDSLARMLTYASRCRKSLAVFSIDVDNFKNINDTYGHSVGDLFLAEIATRLRSCTGEDEVIGRVGGDEFLLLSKDAGSRTAAEAIGKRLLGAVAHPIQVNSFTLPPSLSIGAAFYPTHGRNLEELLAAADKAMYVAKRAGKNQCASLE